MIVRWLTGVVAWAFGRGWAKRGQAAEDEATGRDLGVNVTYDSWRRSLTEAALAHEALDAMRGERDRWRGRAIRAIAAAKGYDPPRRGIGAFLTVGPNGPSYVAASRAGRLHWDRGYAQAEADVAAWLRGSDASQSPIDHRARTHDIAACVERGDHRKPDRSERCAGCGATPADERGRYVLRTTNGYCDSCMSGPWPTPEWMQAIGL